MGNEMHPLADMPRYRGVTAAAEAARRYPEIDVAQGPSGRWYRVTVSGGMAFPLYYESEAHAKADKFCDGGVMLGDERTVAALLLRHAERGGR
jgi:hypothetical protein